MHAAKQPRQGENEGRVDAKIESMPLTDTTPFTICRRSSTTQTAGTAPSCPVSTCSPNRRTAPPLHASAVHHSPMASSSRPNSILARTLAAEATQRPAAGTASATRRRLLKRPPDAFAILLRSPHPSGSSGRAWGHSGRLRLPRRARRFGPRRLPAAGRADPTRSRGG